MRRTPSALHLSLPTSANRLGARAVPFTLKDSSGKIHRLQDYRGQWLLLVFHRHLA